MQSIIILIVASFLSVPKPFLLFVPEKIGTYSFKKSSLLRGRFISFLELLKKSVMIGIALMGFSITLAVMKLPFVPIRLNVESWWIMITGVLEYLYFCYDEHDYF